MSSRVYRNVMDRNDPKAYEQPYVVLLSAFDYLSPNYFHHAWTFSHPNRQLDQENKHNVRRTGHPFPVPHRGVMHGIGGYFEAVLYGNIELSIKPDTIQTKSPNMTSWFPIFFPLKQPLQLMDNSIVDITFWRETDGRKVWYEWSAEASLVQDSAKQVRYASTTIHNQGGASYHMSI